MTGSTKGVGRSIAEAFAAAGANLVLHGRSTGAEADSAIQACRAQGARVEFITGDLSADTPIVVKEVFTKATSALPNIDILVNNAGNYNDLPFLEMDYARLERTFRLNVFSVFLLTQCFARQWVRDQTAGRVLMIGSINGRLAEPTHSAYDASKGAVEMLVKTLCVELAPLGVRVNGLAPGLVRTPLTSIIDRDERFRRWMELHTPSREVPSSDVCGAGAVYLCSDAARHVHGQMLLVDGGMSAWQQPDMPENFR